MPRPRKCRRICALPYNESFGPLSGERDSEEIEMSLDEYETIRLIDLMGRTQEECAEQMGVARTTIQAVYNNARRKLAEALVNGRRLVVRGGDYVVCPHAGACCGKSCSRRQREDEGSVQAD